MADIFNNTILCSKCNAKMQRAQVEKDGFVLRAVVCPQGHDKIIHPADKSEYEKFVSLKNKDFRVKMRLVGNSYAVSIPKEIVSFIREQEKIMDNMVRLCFEDSGRLSLNFNGHEEQERTQRVVRAREVKMIRNGKPILHSKEFYDSANPSNSKKIVRLGEK